MTVSTLVYQISVIRCKLQGYAGLALRLKPKYGLPLDASNEDLLESLEDHLSALEDQAK